MLRASVVVLVLASLSVPAWAQPADPTAPTPAPPSAPAPKHARFRARARPARCALLPTRLHAAGRGRALAATRAGAALLAAGLRRVRAALLPVSTASPVLGLGSRSRRQRSVGATQAE